MAQAPGGDGACTAPWFALAALAALGFALWLLSRFILWVPGVEQSAAYQQPVWSFGSLCVLVFPWIAGMLPLVAAGLAFEGYDATRAIGGVPETASSLALIAWGAALALLLVTALLDWLTHGRPHYRAIPAKLVPDKAWDPAVWWILVGIGAAIWLILLLLGIVTAGHGGALSLLALYARLMTLLLTVSAWWYGGYEPLWPAAYSLLAWAVVSAASSMLGLPGGASLPTLLFGGGCLTHLLYKGAWSANPDPVKQPRRWVFAAGAACLWGVLSLAAPWLAADTLDPTRSFLGYFRSTGVLALGWAGLTVVGRHHLALDRQGRADPRRCGHHAAPVVVSAPGRGGAE